MTMEEFYFSKKVVKDNDRFIILLSLFNLPFVLAFSFLISGFNVKESFIVTAFTYLFLLVLFAIEIPLINRKQLRTKLQLFKNEIVELKGAKKRNFQWSEVSKIKVLNNRLNQIHKIIITLKNKKALSLYGFHDMNKLINLIKERVPNNVSLNKKRMVLNKKRVFVLTGLLWLTFLVLTFYFKI